VYAPTPFVLIHPHNYNRGPRWIVDRLIQQNKAGPNCAIRMLLPFTSNRISTWAECPPELENATMDEILRQNAEAFTNRNQLRLPSCALPPLLGGGWVRANFRPSTTPTGLSPSAQRLSRTFVLAGLPWVTKPKNPSPDFSHSRQRTSKIAPLPASFPWAHRCPPASRARRARHV
jgi:hypothetical protein